MSIDNWDEFRTAYQVAKHGTVSGAAHVLGVHHATAIRHIDALEARLGVKLFQRHARGYTPTDAGKDLLNVAAATDDQINQLVGRLQGIREDISGPLNITTVRSMHTILVPALAEFQAAHPNVQINFMSDERLFRLEYGEAHIALRAGPKPQEPDNVVQSVGALTVKLCATRQYCETHGKPNGPEQFSGHRFVTANRGARPPFAAWLEARITEEQIVFRSADFRASEAAVFAGMGIGFVSSNHMQQGHDLVEVHPPIPEWAAPIWLVTHVDLHRTPKVQAALKYLKTGIEMAFQS